MPAEAACQRRWMDFHVSAWYNPDNPTKPYTAALRPEVSPNLIPKTAATRSRWNTPARPQFSAPIMTSAAAITSSFFIFEPSFLFLFEPVLSGHYLILKKNCFTVKNLEEPIFSSG